MDTTKLIGKSVKHVSYGSGKIAAVNDKYIQITFDRGESKRFQFPQVFVSYLKVEDVSLMSEILTGLWIGDQIEVSDEAPPVSYRDMSAYYGLE